MADLHYVDLARWLENSPRTWPRLRPELAGPLTAFVSNIERAAALALFPARAAYTASIEQLRLDVATYRVRGTLVVQPGSAVGEDIRAEMKRTEQEVYAAAVPEPPYSKVTSGATHIETFAQAVDLMGVGLRAVLSGVLLTSWTAFEALAADLWETAVNVVPHALDLGKVNWNDIRRITKGNYDLRGRVGELARESSDFQKLEAIRERYREVFKDHGQRVIEIVTDSCFEALASLRNVLVHRGGIADYQYFEKTQRLSTLPKAASGTAVPLDGEIVIRLLEPVLQRSIDLLHAVDLWVTRHQPTSPGAEAET